MHLELGENKTMVLRVFTWNLSQGVVLAAQESRTKLHEADVTSFNGAAVSTSGENANKHLRHLLDFSVI